MELAVNPDLILDRLVDDGEEASTAIPPVGAKPPRLRYTHEAMIDFVLANPSVSQDQIAAHFGYSASWISTIFCSEAFQAKLAARRDEIVDPTLRMTIKEQLEGLMSRSLEILRVKLSRPAASVPDNLALQAAKITAQAAGYGARVQEPPSAPPVSVEIHLEQLGGNLEALLRRKRQVIEHDSLGEGLDSEVTGK